MQRKSQLDEIKEYQVFLENFILKCASAPEFADASLNESTVRHLIVEKVDEEQLDRLADGMKTLNKYVKTTEELLTTLGLDVRKMKSTQAYLTYLMGTVKKNRDRLLALASDTMPFFSWGDNTISTKAYAATIASEQKDFFDFYQGVISAFQRVKKYTIDTFGDDEEEIARITKGKTLAQFLKSKAYDMQKAKKAYGAIFRRSLKKSRGFLRRIGSWFANLIGPKLGTRDWDYDAMGGEMAEQVFSVRVDQLMEINLDNLPPVPEDPPTVSAPSKKEVQNPPPASDTKRVLNLSNLASSRKGKSEDEDEDEEGSDSDREASSGRGGKKGRGGIFGGAGGSRGKLTADQIQQIQDIADEVFPDEEDKKRPFGKALKGAGLIESRKRVTSEADSLARWQKIAGIK